MNPALTSTGGDGRGVSIGRAERLIACLVWVALAMGLAVCPAVVFGQASNPILPGDHPDPTIIRIGKTYWTTSTSGNWAPQFALYHSTDLKHWTAAGAVFPETPGWATGDFWAPELVSDRGRVMLYYAARKRGGPLCVGAATAAKGEGPYTDQGPIVCEKDGSIDPSFVRDENGQPFLIWKEDGNSEGKPTPIWAQPLSSDLVHVTGTKTQLIVNEPSSWEGGVVEAPYIFRHAGQFYLFYAGNACCGTECRYAEGVARASHLLGPWVKDPANPVIRPNAAWKCPGHGTAVHATSGQDYFLYHAYPTVGMVYLGRESVLDRITWNKEGWPEVNGGRGPSGGETTDHPEAVQNRFVDDFRGSVLDPEWRWPIGRTPVFQVGGGGLTLDAGERGKPVFIGRSLMSDSYTATVGVDADARTDGGLALVGDGRNAMLLAVRSGNLELSRRSGGNNEVVWHTALPSGAASVWLRVSSAGHAKASFSYSLDGTHWMEAGGVADLAGLPPWDQGLRVGLAASGAADTRVTFRHFSLGEANP